MIFMLGPLPASLRTRGNTIGYLQSADPTLIPRDEIRPSQTLRRAKSYGERRGHKGQERDRGGMIERPRDSQRLGEVAPCQGVPGHHEAFHREGLDSPPLERLAWDIDPKGAKAPDRARGIAAAERELSVQRGPQGQRPGRGVGQQGGTQALHLDRVAAMADPSARSLSLLPALD